MINHEQQIQYSRYCRYLGVGAKEFLYLSKDVRLRLSCTELGKVNVSREAQGNRFGPLVQVAELPVSLQSLLEDLDDVAEAVDNLQTAESILSAHENRGYKVLAD